MAFGQALVQQRVQPSSGSRRPSAAGRSARLSVVARGNGRFFIGG